MNKSIFVIPSSHRYVTTWRKQLLEWLSILSTCQSLIWWRIDRWRTMQGPYSTRIRSQTDWLPPVGRSYADTPQHIYRPATPFAGSCIRSSYELLMGQISLAMNYTMYDVLNAPLVATWLSLSRSANWNFCGIDEKPCDLNMHIDRGLASTRSD